MLYSTVNLLISICIQLLRTLALSYAMSYHTQIAKLRLAAQFKQLSDEMTRLRLLPPDDPRVEERMPIVLDGMDMMQQLGARCTDADAQINLMVPTTITLITVIMRNLRIIWIAFFKRDSSALRLDLVPILVTILH